MPATRLTLCLSAAALLAAALPASAQESRFADDREETEGGEFAARRLVNRAEELIEAGERERGVRMLRSVLDQFPESRARFGAYLGLGRALLDQGDFGTAIGYLRNVQNLRRDDEELSADDLDMVLESLYLTGTAHYRMGAYNSVFPVLRRITERHPNTVWANQAFYYIGMAHFAQSNWQQAIDALEMVGTSIDPESPGADVVEAGRRLYVKIEDGDLPILHRLGEEIRVEATTSRGDKVTATAVPMSGRSDIFLASVATEVAPINRDDEVLQVSGGDTITVRYIDANTREGEANVVREAEVRVVSTGAVSFTLGDFETPAPAAFQNQPLFVMLHDADHDVSDRVDTALVEVVSRYQLDADELDEAEDILDLDRLLEDGTERWEIRDRTTLTLRQFGEGTPRRDARFTGRIHVRPPGGPDAPAPEDGQATLRAEVGDEILVTYVDEVHAFGEAPRTVEMAIAVMGELDTNPSSTQDVVTDPVLRARKNLVEGTAYLELARIFKSMGLEEGAAERANEGLVQANDIIRTRDTIPSSLREEAFKLTWELHLVKEDYEAAMAVCNVFNQMFPESPFVDQALVGLGNIKLAAGEHGEAIAIFNRVLSLQNSQARAEATYRIGEAMEKTPARGQEAAIPYFNRVVEQFPDSEFAGPALAKMVDYHIDRRDYATAHDMLGRVMEDYPDAEFRDAMLLKWVLVSFRRGDFAHALEKCQQLIFQYPESEYAARARELMPRIEARIQ